MGKDKVDTIARASDLDYKYALEPDDNPGRNQRQIGLGLIITKKLVKKISDGKEL